VGKRGGKEKGKQKNKKTKKKTKTKCKHERERGWVTSTPREKGGGIYSGQ
jgi:hypothetical protein